MHLMGNGAPQDYVESYKWSFLAAAQGNSTARKSMAVAARKMTPKQIQEAERLARQWKQKK
jgi:hypothetical protein